MKRALSLLACAALTGCISGPSYLIRSVDDAQNNHYSRAPLGAALLTEVIPLYPVLKVLAAIPDYLVLNPVQFWGFDVWDGDGAAFEHDNPLGEKEPWFK